MITYLLISTMHYCTSWFERYLQGSPHISRDLHIICSNLCCFHCQIQVNFADISVDNSPIWNDMSVTIIISLLQKQPMTVYIMLSIEYVCTNVSLIEKAHHFVSLALLPDVSNSLEVLNQWNFSNLHSFLRTFLSQKQKKCAVNLYVRTLEAAVQF